MKNSARGKGRAGSALRCCRLELKLPRGVLGVLFLRCSQGFGQREMAAPASAAREHLDVVLVLPGDFQRPLDKDPLPVLGSWLGAAALADSRKPQAAPLSSVSCFVSICSRGCLWGLDQLSSNKAFQGGCSADPPRGKPALPLSRYPRETVAAPSNPSRNNGEVSLPWQGMQREAP